MWDVLNEQNMSRKALILDREEENHVFYTFPQYYESVDFMVQLLPDENNCPNSATKCLAAADRLKQGRKVYSS
jgi:hypothetical protein